MQIKTYGANGLDTDIAVGALCDKISAEATPPDFLMLLLDSDHDMALAQQAVTPLGARALHGATSCLGALVDDGSDQSGACSVAALAIWDDAGDYGSAYQALDGAPKAAARAATAKALELANRSGEIPDLIWVTAVPGSEEEILQGIQDVVGTSAPIIGGSAADNTVSGDWHVFSAEPGSADGVVVSVLFPSSEVSFAYGNGYAPTEHSGRVTRVEGRRLYEVDGRPALDVYREWTGEAFAIPSDGHTENILSAATLWPLGREVYQFQGLPHFLLAHPAVAHADGSMDLFANLEQGELLTQMHGSSEALADRAGRVARQARQACDGQIFGALMVYCGGCMLSIRDRLDVVHKGTSEALDQAPFLTHFSFGEQGVILGSGNRHGNLMISCIVFSEA